eukprot:3131702-Pleurochrysis_carterae.AAC.1
MTTTDEIKPKGASATISTRCDRERSVKVRGKRCAMPTKIVSAAIPKYPNSSRRLPRRRPSRSSPGGTELFVRSSARSGERRRSRRSSSCTEAAPTPSRRASQRC